jgi:hypothetical protein
VIRFRFRQARAPGLRLSGAPPRPRVLYPATVIAARACRPWLASGLRLRAWLSSRCVELSQRRAQRIEARGVRKFVVFDCAPDCRGNSGKLVGGEVNCRHGPDIIGDICSTNQPHVLAARSCPRVPLREGSGRQNAHERIDPALGRRRGASAQHNPIAPRQSGTIPHKWGCPGAPGDPRPNREEQSSEVILMRCSPQ